MTNHNKHIRFRKTMIALALTFVAVGTIAPADAEGWRDGDNWRRQEWHEHEARAQQRVADWHRREWRDHDRGDIRREHDWRGSESRAEPQCDD